MTFVSTKKVIKVAVNKDADKVISEWAAANDMTKIGVASRIYNWFGRQDEAIQRTILGLYGEQAPDIARMILESQAKLCEDEPQGKHAAPQDGALPGLEQKDGQARTGNRKAGTG